LINAEVFSEQRAEWKAIAARCYTQANTSGRGQEMPDELKYGREATSLRVAVAKTLRDEVQKLRAESGYRDDDPSLANAEAWERKPIRSEQVHKQNDSPVEKD
jgi:hypothetical protein